MPTKPTYEELARRIDALEEDARRYQRLEAALEDQNRLMNTLMDNLQVGVFMVDAGTGKPLLVNKRAMELLGRGIAGSADTSSLAEIYQAYRLDTGALYPADEMPVVRAMQGESRHVDDMVVVQPGGRRILVEVFGSPVRDSDGNILAGLASFADITERKRSEQALRQSEKTLGSIFKAAPTGIGMTRERVIIQANDRLCEMTGHLREELIGQNARILYPTEEDYRYVGKAKYDQIRLHGTGTVETHWQHKDGRILDILLSSTPINLDDWSAGVTFTALDITERKRSEEKLRRAHEMFLTVLDSIEATIYVADMETYEILFMNRHMIESFGKDLTGQKCWMAFRGESGPCAHCTNKEIVDEDGRPNGVKVWQDKNPIAGKWYINYDRAIEWVDGRVVRIQIATDITDLKRLESQLQQSQKMEAIGNLAGGIAHDFNNILSGVIGYSELSLLDTEKGSALERNLREIHRAGLRARDLVRQILTFARQADSERKPVSVSRTATEALKLLRSTLPTSIEIRSRILSESLMMGDPTKIHQIFMNLCTNAGHAMEESGGALDVAVEDVLWHAAADLPADNGRDRPHIRITISDTGKGIPEKDLPMIFEPYFTTKPIEQGTGLGLAVVHGIVKGYGGEILVESAPGRGTTFWLYLPAIETAPLPARQKEETGSLASGSERVLFVDDEKAICATGKRSLERLGYRVTTQTSSIDALALFRSDPGRFDIVITDMTMPTMNGDKLAAELLRIRPDIPVVLCTGYSRIMSQGKAARLGIRALIMKPLTISELSTTVREVLEAASAAADPI